MVTASVDTVVCTNAVPFVWNGINITGAGSYDYTTTASSGCDSTTTLNVTLSSVVTASVDTVVCQNSIPFVWNGINITGAGSYDYTTTASSGCDSTTTLNVTLSSVVTASVDTVVCTNAVPFTWNGINITGAGSYDYTTTASSGCDSTTTLNVTLSSVVTASVDTVVCQNSIPFVWNGINITGAGSYDYTTTASSGCDSTTTLNVTLSSVVTASVDTVVCTNAVPFIWNGINITGAGSYDYTTTASSGCDSTTTLNVTLSSVVTASVDTVVCTNAVPFTWNGINITGAGSYDYTTTASSGCDSTTTLNVTLSSVVTASVDTVVCQNSIPFVWNGINITGAGSYDYTTTASSGCDSTTTLNVTLSSVVTASVDTVVCTNAVPFTWNGINITGAGSYDYTTTASSGCDSTTTLNVTLSSVVTASVDTVVCTNAVPFTWNGINITGAGSYDYTTTASSGCDSTTTLNVTLSSVVTASVDTVVCQNSIPFVWNGINITGAGSYDYTTTASSGCDSTTTLNVTLSSVVTASVDTVVCQNSIPFVWNGINITGAGSYDYTTTASSGCDSTTTLNVTLSSVVTASVDTVVCHQCSTICMERYQYHGSRKL